MTVSGAAASPKPPPVDQVAGAEELHSLECDILAQRYRAGGALEYGKAALPRRVHAAVVRGPVGRIVDPGPGAALDRAVADGVGPVPELETEAAGADDQVDLASGRGRDQQLVRDERRRQASDQQAIVGERSAIIDEPVDAAAEPAGIGDVERAVEREPAGDDDEVVGRAADDVGQAELVIEQRARIEHQRADRQGADARPRRQASAVGDGHRAADAAGAAEPRAVGDLRRSRDRSVDQQLPAFDAGSARIAAGQL